MRVFPLVRLLGSHLSLGSLFRCALMGVGTEVLVLVVGAVSTKKILGTSSHRTVGVPSQQLETPTHNKPSDARVWV